MDASNRDAGVAAVVKWFNNDHLSGDIKEFSENFHDFAEKVLGIVEKDTPEVKAGFRKLLEAKDCFVRAYSEISKDVKDTF